MNVSQVVGSTIAEPQISGDADDIEAVAPGAIGFRVDGDADAETPDEARRR